MGLRYDWCEERDKLPRLGDIIGDEFVRSIEDRSHDCNRDSCRRCLEGDWDDRWIIYYEPLGDGTVRDAFVAHLAAKEAFSKAESELAFAQRALAEAEFQSSHELYELPQRAVTAAFKREHGRMAGHHDTIWHDGVYLHRYGRRWRVLHHGDCELVLRHGRWYRPLTV